MPNPPNHQPRRQAAISLALATLPAVILGIVGVSYLRYEAAIAEKDLQSSAERFAQSVSQRLRWAYEDYLLSETVVSRTVKPESIQQLLVPGLQASKIDREVYEKFQTLIQNPAVKAKTIAGQLPGLREIKTPAGLPLYPIAQLRAAKAYLKEDDTESGSAMLRDLLESLVNSHTSIISESLLSRVSEIAKERNLESEIELSVWSTRFEAKTTTREILSRNRDYLKSFGSQYTWFEDRGNHYVRIPASTSGLVILSKVELEDLAGTALADTLKNRDLYRYPLAFRLMFEKEVIVPAPLNDKSNRQAEFEERGFDVIAHNQSGSELVSIGTGTPFDIRVFAANYEDFEKAVRTRVFQQGTFLALVLCCLGFGVWRTWRTLESQRALAERQSNLISSISHELRSPVAGIRLMSERLSNEGSNEKIRGKYSRLIEKESSRLGALIENILDAGRITDGKKLYQFEWTDLNGLVSDTVERMRPLAANDDKQIDLLISSPDISAKVDPVAIQQALGNLIDNALKFSGTEAVITISLDEDGESGTVSLTVADKGVGIAEEEQSKIFNLFYRAGSELQRETTGTGLGLHLVQHIIKSHGGTIEVESTPGEGSTFSVHLPRELKRGK